MGITDTFSLSREREVEKKRIGRGGWDRESDPLNYTGTDTVSLFFLSTITILSTIRAPTRFHSFYRHGFTLFRVAKRQRERRGACGRGKDEGEGDPRNDTGSIAGPGCSFLDGMESTKRGEGEGGWGSKGTRCKQTFCSHARTFGVDFILVIGAHEVNLISFRKQTNKQTSHCRR